MLQPQRDFEQDCEQLRKRFNSQLRVIAQQSVKVWFSQARLDKLLVEHIGALEGCELLYAIDRSGRQVSSNIQLNAMDGSAFGQDLSDRPYAVKLSVLSNVSSHVAFACDAYVSQATQHPCVTVMYGVTYASWLLGFIAADFYTPVE